MYNICRETSFGSKTNLKYLRGPAPTKRHERRLRQQRREREKTMENCKTLVQLFQNAAGMAAGEGNNAEIRQEAETQGPTTPAITTEECLENLEASISDLEKALRSKTVNLTGQNMTRHQAVLRLLYYQKTRKHEETRKDMALKVARCFNRGKWFAERLVSWENSWRKSRTIPKGKQGCFQKVKSWLTDEGVELAVREYLSGAGESK
jgi:hypothetical protein